MPALQISFDQGDARWRDVLRENRALFRRALNRTFQALDLPPLKFAVAISLVNDADIRQLNAQYRHKDKPTNVLSFPQLEEFSNLENLPQPVALGDIVLAYETIAREAEDQQKTLSHHVTHLLVHGLLHLCGHDHIDKQEEKEMEALEISILAGLGIADPYN